MKKGSPATDKAGKGVLERYNHYFTLEIKYFLLTLGVP